MLRNLSLIVVCACAMLSCGTQNVLTASQIDLRSGINGQGMHYLTFSYTPESGEREEISDIRINMISVPFEWTVSKEGNALAEAMILMDKRGETSALEPIEKYSSLRGLEMVDITLEYREGMMRSVRVPVETQTESIP